MLRAMRRGVNKSMFGALRCTQDSTGCQVQTQASVHSTTCVKQTKHTSFTLPSSAEVMLAMILEEIIKSIDIS